MTFTASPLSTTHRLEKPSTRAWYQLLYGVTWYNNNNNNNRQSDWLLGSLSKSTACTEYTNNPLPGSKGYFKNVQNVNAIHTSSIICGIRINRLPNWFTRINLSSAVAAARVKQHRRRCPSLFCLLPLLLSLPAAAVYLSLCLVATAHE